jgi:hypothetical protein
MRRVCGGDLHHASVRQPPRQRIDNGAQKGRGSGSGGQQHRAVETSNPREVVVVREERRRVPQGLPKPGPRRPLWQLAGIGPRRQEPGDVQELLEHRLGHLRAGSRDQRLEPSRQDPATPPRVQPDRPNRDFDRVAAGVALAYGLGWASASLADAALTGTPRDLVAGAFLVTPPVLGAALGYQLTSSPRAGTAAPAAPAAPAVPLPLIGWNGAF